MAVGHGGSALRRQARSRCWEWATSASVGDSGLAGLQGVLTVVPGSTDDAFDEHGFWRMSRGGRFGWKGLDVAGPVIPPAEYARYWRYLVARYGAGPAIYLVGADGSGCEPQLPAGSEEIQRWDYYQQPTGLHYRPRAANASFQDAGWLDFQWCQTGHR